MSAPVSLSAVRTAFDRLVIGLIHYENNLQPIKIAKTRYYCWFYRYRAAYYRQSYHELLPRHYAGLSGDDITFFFTEWKPIHVWFYLLFIGCVFYGVNTFLCTLDSIIRKAKGGVKKISLYGASAVHIGFIITLVVHLVGGLCSSSLPPVSVADEWTDLGGRDEGYRP